MSHVTLMVMVGPTAQCRRQWRVYNLPYLRHRHKYEIKPSSVGLRSNGTRWDEMSGSSKLSI